METSEATDKELAGNLHAFQAALRAKHQDLEPARVDSIVIGLDGSNQDASTVGLTEALARTRALRVSPVLCHGADARPDFEARLALLRDAGLELASARVHMDHPRPWEPLLESVHAERAQLLVVDAPFLEDFTELGRDSVGSCLDVLMARAPVPVLVVRAPLEDPLACLARVILPIHVRAREQPRAAAWALRLVAKLGRIQLLAVVDEDMLRRADWIEDGADFENLDEESLAGLREPKNAGLIAALQRQAAAAGLGCRVSVRSGELVEELLALGGPSRTFS